MDWEIFRAEGLAKALTDAGYDVSERTVNRWKAGTHRPSKSQLEAIRKIVGAHENTAPSEEGAASELLRLWGGTEPPAWSNVQAAKVIAEIRRDRSEAFAAMARRIGRMSAEELQELLSQLPDGSTPATSGP